MFYSNMASHWLFLKTDIKYDLLPNSTALKPKISTLLIYLCNFFFFCLQNFNVVEFGNK